VYACIVVINPFCNPNTSFNVLAIGAKQLVVQEAPDITVSLPSNTSWFTLNTTVFKSPVAGADITTFLAPACKWSPAFSWEVKNPVHSNTISTPNSAHGKSAGFLSAVTFISCPLTTKAPSLTSISPLNLPWAESYLNKWANVLASVKSFIATTSNLSVCSINFLKANLPILPKPFIATLTILFPPNMYKIYNIFY